MNIHETSAIVQEQGHVVVSGVPFTPGTQVEVMIRPIADDVTAPGVHVAERAERLLAALDKARNVESIGAFHRGDLYDRDVLR